MFITENICFSSNSWDSLWFRTLISRDIVRTQHVFLSQHTQVHIQLAVVCSKHPEKIRNINTCCSFNISLMSHNTFVSRNGRLCYNPRALTILGLRGSHTILCFISTYSLCMHELPSWVGVHYATSQLTEPQPHLPTNKSYNIGHTVACIILIIHTTICNLQLFLLSFFQLVG